MDGAGGGGPPTGALCQGAEQPRRGRSGQLPAAVELRGRTAGEPPDGEPGARLDAPNPEARSSSSSSGWDQPLAQTGAGSSGKSARGSASLASGGRKRRRSSPTSASSRRVATNDVESYYSIQEPSITQEDSASGNHSSTKAPASKAAGPSQGAEEEERTTESEGSQSSQSSLWDEATQESHARCLFRKKYLSRLIVRAMRGLKLSGTLEKDPQTGMPKQASEVDKVLLRCKRSYPQFAFPWFFEEQLKEEWAVPLGHRLNFVHTKKLYPFSGGALDFLKVPLVDGPVIGIVLGYLLSVDGGGSLKGVTDRNSELALCRTHEALALSVRASVATSLVARASILWIRRLLTKSSAVSKKHKDCLQMIEQALTFVADGSLDTVRFSARAMASAVVVRRHLWLKSCAVDSVSKTNLATSPFLGGKVFGDVLEDFLKEMKAGRYGSEEEEEETAVESEDSEFLSDEEKEELSDEEEEPVQESHTRRLLIQKDLFPLISKAMRVLELSDTLEEDCQARTPKGNFERMFLRRKRSYPRFAFPQFFEEEIKEAWAIPLDCKVNTSHTQKLYPFSRHVLDLIKVPIVDAPVTALISGAAFPRDGEGSLKCKADCNCELALCRTHEALALSIRASVATSIAPLCGQVNCWQSYRLEVRTSRDISKG